MKWMVALLTMLVVSCGGHGRQEKHEADPECVYVCLGRSAKRYHSVRDCKGLSRCSREVCEVTVEDAEDNGKTPCRLCVK